MGGKKSVKEQGGSRKGKREKGDGGTLGGKESVKEGEGGCRQ